MLGRGPYFGMHWAQIDVPSPLADVVGVTDCVSELRPLAADITNSCHNSIVPSRPVAKQLFYRKQPVFAKVLAQWGMVPWHCSCLTVPAAPAAGPTSTAEKERPQALR